MLAFLASLVALVSGLVAAVLNAFGPYIIPVVLFFLGVQIAYVAIRSLVIKAGKAERRARMARRISAPKVPGTDVEVAPKVIPMYDFHYVPRRRANAR